MKKLSKNLNTRKENLQSYDIYYGCSCDCSGLCDSADPRSRFREYKVTDGSSFE